MFAVMIENHYVYLVSISDVKVATVAEQAGKTDMVEILGDMFSYAEAHVD